VIGTWFSVTRRERLDVEHPARKPVEPAGQGLPLAEVHEPVGRARHHLGRAGGVAQLEVERDGAFGGAHAHQAVGRAPDDLAGGAVGQGQGRAERLPPHRPDPRPTVGERLQPGPGRWRAAVQGRAGKGRVPVLDLEHQAEGAPGLGVERDQPAVGEEAEQLPGASGPGQPLLHQPRPERVARRRDGVERGRLPAAERRRPLHGIRGQPGCRPLEDGASGSRRDPQLAAGQARGRPGQGGQRQGPVAGDDHDEPRRQGGEEVPADQAEGRVAVVEVVGVLEDQRAGGGQGLGQLLGHAGECGRPARDRTRLRAHELEGGPAEPRRGALHGRDQRGEQHAWVTVLGAEPDPQRLPALPRERGGQALAEQVGGFGGEQGPPASGRLVEDWVLGGGTRVIWDGRLRDERHPSPEPLDRVPRCPATTEQTGDSCYSTLRCAGCQPIWG
jgi:hypothetical protein